MSLPADAPPHSPPPQSPPAQGPLPLAGIRVLDLTDGPGQICGRLLADLGADVLLAEPPDGCPPGAPSRWTAASACASPCTGANKRSEVIDWRSRRAGTAAGAGRVADILIEDQRPGALAAAGLGPDDLHRANPRLVVTSISDFGQTGPYRDWAGTDWVHMALNSELSRSGLPGQAPLMPPGQLAARRPAPRPRGRR